MANLQVKNLPDELHERLREKARSEHVTVSAYVTRLIERDVARLSMREWLTEGRKLPRHDPIDIEALMDEVRDEIEGR